MNIWVNGTVPDVSHLLSTIPGFGPPIGPVRQRLDRYAPVQALVLDRAAVAGGSVRGYAAPARGVKPCRLELVSQGKLLAVADACGYSAAARAAGVRHGWCRFDLHGLVPAIALGAPIHLRCAVTGDVLDAVGPQDGTDRPGSAASTRPDRPPLSITGLRAFAAALHGCHGLDQVAPFIEHCRSTRGDRACVEALYVYLHKRAASGTEVDDFLRAMPAGWGIALCWDRIVSSQEYAARRHQPVHPGVFDPGFPFGLDLLA